MANQPNQPKPRPPFQPPNSPPPGVATPPASPVPHVPMASGLIDSRSAVATIAVLESVLAMWTVVGVGVATSSYYADVDPMIEAATLDWVARHPGWSTFDYGERPTGMLRRIVGVRAPNGGDRDLATLLWRR